MTDQNEQAMIVAEQHASLPSLVRRAADQLALATTAAEVLDARDLAAAAYDAAKSAARFARAKGAHDELIAKVHRAQADALEIEAMAKRRLADEYDAAQERGEVQSRGGDRVSNVSDRNNAPTSADLNLSRKDIHEARQIRDAEVAEPGIISRTIMERLHAGHEPTKAAVRQAVIEVVSRPSTGAPRTSRANPIHQPNPAYDAVNRIIGGCASISETLEAKGADYVIGGFLDAAMRARSIAKFTLARDALTHLLEVIDAD